MDVAVYNNFCALHALSVSALIREKVKMRVNRNERVGSGLGCACFTLGISRVRAGWGWGSVVDRWFGHVVLFSGLAQLDSEIQFILHSADCGRRLLDSFDYDLN